LIDKLLKSTCEIFAVSQYTFTTIPTYPSGQIRFLMCLKEQCQVLSIPTCKVTNTCYYNEDVHKVAFVLPQFVRSFLE
ncbi:hypothetical protein BDR06DRAFT_828099, partial [Suillus hirtellus]